MSDMGNWGWIAFWSVNAVTVVILVKCIVGESTWPDSSSDKATSNTLKKQNNNNRVAEKTSVPNENGVE